MKYFISVLFFSLSIATFSQNDTKATGLFYKFSFATTLTLNEDFEFETDQTLINPSAFFFNNTVGIQVDNKSSIGFNVEYDWHSRQGLNFLPVYVSYQYNIFEYEENLFIRAGYGRMIGIGKSFEKGSLYKVGLGIQVLDQQDKNSFLIGLDFSRKRYGFIRHSKLSSVSVFLEFEIF